MSFKFDIPSFMKKSLIILLVAFVFMSCNNESKVEKEIAAIDIDVTVERFDRLFANANEASLPELKQAYPFMFSKRYNDSVWINRIQDTLQQQLNFEVDKIHGNFKDTEEGILSFFQHLKYYFKEFRTPRIITVTNDVDYRNKVIVTDSITLIALDTYLGASHDFYYDIYDYIKLNMDKDQIVPDLAFSYAEKFIYQPRRKTLLDEMIYFGKTLYFKDVMLPETFDEIKIGYTKEQLNWATINEENIWQHFVENEMLFSTDNKLPARFINPAPFSKFNLELDGESPGRLGQYIGWQIVRAYAKNNDATLQEILNMNPENIFNKSKYKPRK